MDTECWYTRKTNQPSAGQSQGRKQILAHELADLKAALKAKTLRRKSFGSMLCVCVCIYIGHVCRKQTNGYKNKTTRDSTYLRCDAIQKACRLLDTHVPHICMYKYIHTCMYVYICMYIYAHIHIYTHICI